MGHTILDRRSALSVGSNLTQTQIGLDSVVTRFNETAADPTLLPAMAVGSMAFRFAKLGLLETAAASGLAKLAPKIILTPSASLLALSAEVTAFRGTSHLLGSWAGRPSYQGVFDPKGWKGSFTDFLALKTFGRMGSVNPVLTHFAQANAMVLGHAASARLGFTDHRAGTYIERLAHAEATNMALGAGMGLMNKLSAGKITALEKATDVRIHSLFPARQSLSLPQTNEAGLAVMAAVRDNTRVNGPVLEMIAAQGEISTRVPAEGFMGRMANPKDGFSAFTFPDGTHAIWIGSPSAFPRVIGERLATTWSGALGAVLVANPKADVLGLIVMHGARKNHWAPDASTITHPKWRGLGGMMAFTRSIPHARDLDPLLQEMSLGSAQGFKFEKLTPEQQAAVNLLGAAEITNGKAKGMGPKWIFIDQTLALNGFETRTGLGGMKSVVLHAPGDVAKKEAMLTMAQVAKALGIYISGGDEGTARGPWTDIFAEAAPMNMAGSRNSHPLIRGFYPSAYTAEGVFQGLLQSLQGVGSGDRGRSVLFQGVGGVGEGVLRKAIQNGLGVAGATNMTVGELVAMRDFAKTRPGYEHVAWMWDRSAARKSLEPDVFAEQEILAVKEGLIIVEGLEAAIVAGSNALLGTGKSTDVSFLSLNATSHQLTPRILDLHFSYGGEGSANGANNVFELDANGSYRPAAEHAVRKRQSTPADSRINQMGAKVVLANALGITEADAQRLAESVGRQVLEDHREAHQNGIPPQVKAEAEAQQIWSDLKTAGEAIGGDF